VLTPGPPRPAGLAPPGPAAPGPARLHWGLSRHARRLITLALAGLVLAVLSRRAEFAATAAPALLLLVTWRQDRPATISLQVYLTSARVVEGEQATVVARAGGTGRHTVSMRLRPARLIGPALPVRDGPGEFRLPFRALRSGSRPVGQVEVMLTDRWHLTEGRVTARLPQLSCLPAPAVLDRVMVLSKLPSRLGEHPARTPGEGIEFAGVREFVPGDRQRRINWPATTRRGTLQLNTFAAERSQSVVLLADATSDVGEPGTSSLDLVLRGTAGLARAYLAVRDRVGLVVCGGSDSWLSPASGRRQFDRIMDLLLAVNTSWSRTTELSRLSRAALPPGALIVVLSPLLNPVLIETLRDLRERGHAVLIVDVLNTRPEREQGGRGALVQLAGRIWRMEQEAIRFSLRELGIPVVHWDGRQALDEPLAPYTRRVMVTHR
jgi:uncharacterized protein (DUF58 family)